MPLSTLKVAELRKLAEEQGISGWEDMTRPELLKALSDTSSDEETQEDSVEESSEETQPEEVKEEVQQAEVSPFESETPKIPLGSKALRMKEKLHSEPKVRIYIPLADGEKPGVTQQVTLNGYPMFIRKGEYVDVPESVADVLAVKMKHKMQVMDHPSRISGDKPVKMTTYGN